ncbi:MAG: hypothetical protein FJY48_12720 [Betaproteobacteria bacterium]|nr:hypothetical protein [Betaproteobacteria bacterium]
MEHVARGNLVLTLHESQLITLRFGDVTADVVVVSAAGRVKVAIAAPHSVAISRGYSEGLEHDKQKRLEVDRPFLEGK